VRARKKPGRRSVRRPPLLRQFSWPCEPFGSVCESQSHTSSSLETSDCLAKIAILRNLSIMQQFVTFPRQVFKFREYRFKISEIFDDRNCTFERNFIFGSRLKLRPLAMEAGLIHPRSPLLAVWNVACLCFLVAIIFETVMFLSFSSYCPLNLLTIAITALFSADIPLQFFIIRVRDGNMIADRRLIAKLYLKSWFCVDVISVAPSLMVLLIESDFCELQSGDSQMTDRLLPSHSSIVPIIHLRMLRLLRAPKYVANVRSYQRLRSGKDDSADPAPDPLAASMGKSGGATRVDRS